MQQITESLRRPPQVDELKTMEHILDIAQAWEAGALPLAGVRTACTGYERWQAMRFVGVGNAEKALLQRLADALVTDQARTSGGMRTKQGWLTTEDLFVGRARVGRDSAGNRVIQFPSEMAPNGNAIYREIPDHKIAEGAGRVIGEPGWSE